MKIGRELDEKIIDIVESISLMISEKDKNKINYNTNNQHVIPKEKRWAVKSASEIAKRGKACAVIHNKDGTISKKDCRE